MPELAAATLPTKREKLGALVLSGIPEDAEIVVGKRMPAA